MAYELSLKRFKRERRFFVAVRDYLAFREFAPVFCAYRDSGRAPKTFIFLAERRYFFVSHYGYLFCKMHDGFV